MRWFIIAYHLLFCMNWLIPWQNTTKLQYSPFSISGPVSDDGGKYICTGTNVAGRTNISAHVTVEYPPVLDQTQVKFWSWDQRPVTLFCKGNIHKGCFFRVVYCQFHLLDCCFHMLNPLTSNLSKHFALVSTSLSLISRWPIPVREDSPLDVLLTFFPVTV